jgi:hypothetical protein
MRRRAENARFLIDFLTGRHKNRAYPSYNPHQAVRPLVGMAAEHSLMAGTTATLPRQNGTPLTKSPAVFSVGASMLYRTRAAESVGPRHVQGNDPQDAARENQRGKALAETILGRGGTQDARRKDTADPR